MSSLNVVYERLRSVAEILCPLCNFKDQCTNYCRLIKFIASRPEAIRCLTSLINEER